ncbi:hypothetical protein RB597_009562 [Gaeumannomyces tritici]
MADPPDAGSSSEPPTIAKAGKQCFDLFQKCYDLGGPLDVLQKSLLEDQLTRFTIWTNMMGVFAGARASMDHRLRETPEVRDTVLSVLEGLAEHLETYSMLLQSQPKHVPESDSLGLKTLERPLRDMAGEISMLFRLSNVIRKASRESQNIKAARKFRILNGEGNDAEPLLRQRFLWHIRSQFAADIQDPSEKAAAEELTQRLASTMFLRQKRVMYRKERYGSKKPIETAKMIQPPQVDTHVAKEPVQSPLVTPRSTEVIPVADHPLVAPNLLSSRATSAGGSVTTLHQDRYKKASSPSSISGTRTIPLSYNKEGNALEFPQRPLLHGGIDKKYQQKKQARWKVFVKDIPRIFSTEGKSRDHEELPVSQASRFVAAVQKLDKDMKSDFQGCVDAVAEFTCPICFHALNHECLTDVRKWESHVTSDLDAYVCLFKGCESPEELYTHSNTWISHMRKHAQRWRCITKSHGRRDFDTREEYIQHIQQDHPRRATGDLDVLADSSTWTPEHLFPSCPLCGERPDSADISGAGCSESHIAHHLRALALTSLPKEEKYDPEDPHHEKLSSNASQGSTRPTVAEDSEEKEQEGPDTSQPHTSEEMDMFPTTQEEEEERARSEWARALEQQDIPKSSKSGRAKFGGPDLEEMELATAINALPSDDVLRDTDIDAFRRTHDAEDVPQSQQEEEQIGPRSPYWPYEMVLEYASPPEAGEWGSDPIIQAFLKHQSGGPIAPETILESKEVLIALRTLRKLVGKREADALRGSIEQLIKAAPSPVPPTKAEDVTPEIPNAASYAVGWITKLRLEFIAARSFLEVEHDFIERLSREDPNSYALGRIGQHNVVIASRPTEYGPVSIASVAKNMLQAFPNVRIGLSIGIAGGAPRPSRDIRLGDVVVGDSVFQYDLGRGTKSQHFTPPRVLRTAVASLAGEYLRPGRQLALQIEQALNYMQGDLYSRPSANTNTLFRPEIEHAASCGGVCAADPQHLVSRQERDVDDDDPAIHLGRMASSEQPMKNSRIRDELAARHHVICFETEAADLIDQFPCLVVRGICDYSDSHGNRSWQGFAAMMAAAYAKGLLRHISPALVEAETRLIETPSQVHGKVHETQQALLSGRQPLENYTNAIMDWLSPAGPSGNADRAKRIRHPGTDLLLSNNSVLQEWKSGARQHKYLWLRVLPESDNKFLGTSVIASLLEQVDHPSLHFYFDKHDEKRKTLDHMLRAFVVQAHTQGIGLHAKGHIARSFNVHNYGTDQPTTRTLSDIVNTLLAVQPNTSIFLENVNESTLVWVIVNWIENIFKRGLARLILTSQPALELDLIPSLFGEENCISLDDGRTSETDMRAAFKTRLMKDSPGGTRNPQIEEPLLSEEATRLLQFVLHSDRPISLPEATDIMATRVETEPRGFSPKRRPMGKADIIKQCPEMLWFTRPNARISAEHVGSEILTINHATFNKEGLFEQDRFSATTAYISMTRTCLAYLADIDGDCADIETAFPFSRHAADAWMLTAAKAEMPEDAVREAAMFLQDQRTFQLWRRIYEEDYSWHATRPRIAQGSALYYACFFGYKQGAECLIGDGADVNARGGYFENALQAAAISGHENVVQLLLDSGANVDAQGGAHGSALQAAASQGYKEIVQLLLDSGANVNARGGNNGNALRAAANGGYRKIVQLLLDSGADINAQEGIYGSTLYVAAKMGHIDIVRLLLDSGAHFNARSNFSDSEFHPNIFQLLLERGGVEERPRPTRGEWEQDVKPPASRPSSTGGTVGSDSDRAESERSWPSNNESPSTGRYEPSKRIHGRAVSRFRPRPLPSPLLPPLPPSSPSPSSPPPAPLLPPNP